MASVRQRLENEGRHSIASNSAPNKTLMVVVTGMPDLVPRALRRLADNYAVPLSENQNFSHVNLKVLRRRFELRNRAAFALTRVPQLG